MSEEDLLNLTEIGSLDSDVDVIMEDYLDEDMQVADANGQQSENALWLKLSPMRKKSREKQFLHRQV